MTKFMEANWLEVSNQIQHSLQTIQTQDLVNNPKFVKDLKTVKDLVPQSIILQQEKTKLETLDALTGSKFVKEFLKLKVQRSDVMVVIMSFLEPN